MMTAATWADMPDNSSDTTPAPQPAGPSSLASNPWVQLVYGPLAAAVLFSLLQNGASLWRGEAVSAAEMAAVKAELAAVKIELASSATKIATLETSDRQRSVELAQVSKTLDKIESYQGATMKLVGEINVQLAEMRGERRKAPK